MPKAVPRDRQSTGAAAGSSDYSPGFLPIYDGAVSSPLGELKTV